jgi:BASS family bile acid:Na+ symporter
MNFAVLRATGLLLAFAIGGFLPALHAYSGLIRYFLIFMLFAVFLRIEPSRKMIHRSQFLAIGFNILFACVLWQLFLRAGYPELAMVAFFTAITPTATATAVIVSFIGGNVTYTVTTFMLSNLLISFCMPVLIPLVVVGTPAIGITQHVLVRVLSVMLVPLLLAMLIRAYSKPFAQKMGERLASWTFFTWIGLVVLIASQARHFLDQQAHIPWALLSAIAGLSLFICATNFMVGYLIGRPQYGLECSQALGQKNNSFTVYLALTYANPLVALGPTIYVLWHNLWNAWQLYRHDKRALDKKTSGAAS